MKKKENRGGARNGAGRKPGKKAFINVEKKEATKVMRVPVGLVEAVQDLISRYNESKKA
jgi:hypothetical protein